MLAAGSLVVYAISAKGNPPQEAHLNDAGVWLSTNQTAGSKGSAAAFGLMNAAVSQFASTLSPQGATTGLDVIQNGNAVAGVNGQGSLIPIDATSLRLNTGDALRVGSAAVKIGGNATSGSLAVLDPLSGRLWAMPFDATLPLTGLQSIDPSSAKPTAKVGAQSDAAVSNSGAIFGVSKARGLTKLTSMGAVWKSSVNKLPSEVNGSLTVTAVGDQPVVMSVGQGSDSPVLVLPGGKVKELTHLAPGGAAVIQQPGPGADEVLIETGKALLGVNLASGNVRDIVAGTGAPVGPVNFGGCQFAAWQGQSAAEARACGTDVRVKPLTSDSGQAITDLAVERDAPFAIDEFRTLNRCLDNAIADAVSSFSSERDVSIAIKQSAESNQRLGFLVHELRNSIGTARLALSALETGHLPISGATGGVLKRSMGSLTTLIDRALAEVRTKHATPLPGETFSLAALIADARDGAALDASERGSAFKVPEVDALLGIRGHRELLLAAIANLLQNAFKFTHPHTEVILHAYASENRVLIDVRDNCGGLSLADVQQMFVPFAQRSGDQRGLGLGLSIAKRNVEADGGVLTVRNVPGTGCVFTISLPRHVLR